VTFMGISMISMISLYRGISYTSMQHEMTHLCGSCVGTCTTTMEHTGSYDGQIISAVAG
jgi:hypothetical protein